VSDPDTTTTDERADLPVLYTLTAEQWQRDVREPIAQLRAMYDKAKQQASELRKELEWFRRENKRLRARLGEPEGER
jgi:hypothetical protein